MTDGPISRFLRHHYRHFNAATVIDAADPAFAPGTGTPEPGGFSSYQMLQLMRGLKGLNLVGMDIVEVSPPYDHADVTAILAANLVFEYLCLVALNRA